MTQVRDDLLAMLHRGKDPFVDPSAFGGLADEQGWASDNLLLTRGIVELQPKIVAEIGVWKGGSTMTMANSMRKHAINGCILAVDTWVGSWEHWFIDENFLSLRLENGYPSLYKTFAANICRNEYQDYVLPVPLDSLNAAEYLNRLGIKCDLIHIDGGHQYESVIADLRSWWPMLRVGGALIGDDYFLDGTTWGGVKQAFDEFFGALQLGIEVVESKCWIKKR